MPTEDHRDQGMVLLRDERDLLWLVLDDFVARGNDRLCDVHFLAREAPAEPPQPFISTFGVVEPREGLAALAEGLARAAEGEVSAMRHDPIGPGLSLELKATGSDETLTFEVVLWLDLVRMNPAMKSRAVRGRHQSGMRMHVTAAALRDFAAGLRAYS
ncbi:MAG: hypothetical protein KDA24_15565 [Deltaproteobacteria bacterium]|nr:hypothetical protein [Deltaproteobacteria bacterium]